MTRARRSLEIHTTSPEFDSLSFPGYRPEKDERRNERTLQLRAGKKLLPRKNGLADEDGTVRILYSAAFRERLKALAAKGYTVRSGVLRCIVFWKAEEDPEETAVLLPDVYLQKNTGSV